jgi:predicted Zn-dependent protease with MMP-like domain
VKPSEREDFDRLLESQLERLPADVREMLEEVAIIVEDEPDAELLRDMGIELDGEPADLCGLHWGIPINERSVQDVSVPIERILIFRGPILRLVEGDRDELKRQIHITLLHEVGHHFGLDEDRLHELGYE